MFDDPAPASPGLGDRVIDWLDRLGKARDGMIVVLGGVYIFGFVSWAVYSYRAHIGFIQIFNTQYLIAGIVPFVSLAVAAVGWWLWQLLPAPIRWFAALVVYVLYFVTLGAIGASRIFERIDWHLDVQLQTLNWSTSVIVFIVGLLLTLLTVVGVRQVEAGQLPARLLPRFMDRYWLPPAQLAFYTDNRPRIIVVGKVLSVIMVCFILFIYFWAIYPGLPPELGGPRPRCADVVIDEGKLPAKLLAGFGVETTRPTLYRSALDGVSSLFGKKPDKKTVIPRAQVLYNDDKTIIFKPAAGIKPATLLELRKDAVGPLVWCSD